MSWPLSILLLFVILLGLWALNTGMAEGHNNQLQRENGKVVHFLPRLKGASPNFRPFRKRTVNDNFGNDQNINKKMHQVGIHTINMEEEHLQDMEKDRKIKQALIQMMGKKLKESNFASKQPQRVGIVTDVDFRREFASDEPNPYVERLRNRFDMP